MLKSIDVDTEVDRFRMLYVLFAFMMHLEGASTRRFQPARRLTSVCPQQLKLLIKHADACTAVPPFLVVAVRSPVLPLRARFFCRGVPFEVRLGPIC